LFGHFTNGLHRIVLDLTSCSFIDSSGLAVLLTHMSRLPAEGVLAVVTPDANLRRLFDLVGLTDQAGFEAHDNLDLAATAIAAHRVVDN